MLRLILMLVVAVMGGLLWTNHQQANALNTRARVPPSEPAALPAVQTVIGAAEIHLYTAAWCGYCKHLKQRLDASAVPYQDHDVETSEEGRRFYDAGDFAGVPITVVGDQTIAGYDANALDAAFSRVGHPVSGLNIN
jgi:glutaredoxin